jgi:hypothetical protein
MAQHDGGPLRLRRAVERVDQARPFRLRRRFGLRRGDHRDRVVAPGKERRPPARLPPVVVEQLVAGDAKEPGQGGVDRLARLDRAHGGEEGLLGQVLGDRGVVAAAREEIAVDLRQRRLVERAEGVRIAQLRCRS